jgi:hypothetical protein
MKRLGIIALVLLIAGGNVLAEDSKATRAAAEKLLVLLEMEENLDNTMKQAMGMTANMMKKRTDLSPEQQQAVQKALEVSTKATLEEFKWAKIKDMFIDIYAEVLTLEELEGLIKFYESPIGQQYIKKQPQLTTASMIRMQKLMEEVMPKIEASVKKAMEELPAE